MYYPFLFLHPWLYSDQQSFDFSVNPVQDRYCIPASAIISIPRPVFCYHFTLDINLPHHHFSICYDPLKPASHFCLSGNHEIGGRGWGVRGVDAVGSLGFYFWKLRQFPGWNSQLHRDRLESQQSLFLNGTVLQEALCEDNSKSWTRRDVKQLPT
jgi:hypothetical protein